MKASDIAAVPIQAGAALRHRRLFHPTGVLAHGSIERLAPPTEGLPVESGAIVGRLSKAVGTPGALPDAAGLAWRMPPAAFAATPWDVLLATAGVGTGSWVGNRVLLRPVTRWSDAVYSSLVPLRCSDELWWVRARTATSIDARGLALDTITDVIGRGGIEFTVEQARGTADFEPLARLSLTEVIPAAEEHHHDVSFDPVRYTAADVQVWPDWLRDLRSIAYRSSREGRDAASASQSGGS
ncbi:MAG: phosphodiesterase [Mycobacterium sp.]|nr:phosphodiesterase [Mycobacterium sp.]